MQEEEICLLVIGNARGDKALGKAPGEELRITCCWTSGVSKGGDAGAANIISFLPGEDTEDKKLYPVCSIF